MNPDADRGETEGTWAGVISLSFTKSLLVSLPPKSSFPSPPLPKSTILPPALLPPLAFIYLLPIFSPTKNERHSIESLSASTRCCPSASSQRQTFPTSFVLLDSFLAALSHPLCLFHLVQMRPFLALHHLSAPMSAVNAHPPLFVMGYSLHQGQGVH